MTNGEILQKMLRRIGRREGRKEGLEQGRRTEALRIARTMLGDGLGMETVERITGLNANDILANHEEQCSL